MIATNKYHFLWYLAWLLLLPLCSLNLSLGQSDMTIFQVWEALHLGPYSDHRYAIILWWVRMPELAVTALAGAALAMSGAALQTLVRNPLADPYLLGISSGGGLGAAIVIAGGLMELVGSWILPSMSFICALLASVWIYKLAHKEQGVVISQLLLAGIALNLCLSALLTLILTLSGQRMEQIWRWLIGHVDGVMWYEIFWLSLGIVMGSYFLLRQKSALMLMENGEDVAWSLGVDTHRMKRNVCIACALLVGVVVAYCGMIGFIGLMTPHFLRPHLRGFQEQLLPLSGMYGALGLCFCHTIGKLSSVTLPIGLITSCLGGLLFLMILRRNQIPNME